MNIFISKEITNWSACESPVRRYIYLENHNLLVSNVCFFFLWRFFQEIRSVLVLEFLSQLLTNKKRTQILFPANITNKK